MVEQKLGDFLMEEGYQRLPSNLPEFTIYFRIENNFINALHVIDYQKNLYITEDQHLHIKEKIKSFFAEKGVKEVHILSLVICGDLKKASRIYMEDGFCWVIDPYSNRLFIFENQISEFYGMRKKLEDFLEQLPDEPQEQHGSSPWDKIEKPAALHKRIPYVTAAFVISNIITFVICTFTGDLLYNIGAFSAYDFLERKEYYRILTSIFLHWDINHLASNMLVLYYLGEVVEKHFGRFGYCLLYLLSGISGYFLSMQHEQQLSVSSRSVGASGAIFGVMGALVILVFVYKGRLRQITMGRLVFMIAYSLYSGFTASNINNAAHIGGLISGIVMAIILQLWIQAKKKIRQK